MSALPESPKSRRVSAARSLTLGRLLAAAAVFSLAGCEQYSTVKIRQPRSAPATPAGRISAKAASHARSKPLVALGEYIQAVRDASLALQRNPADTAARRDYNFALARILGTIRDADLNPWAQPLRVPAPDGGEYILTHRPDPRPHNHPSLYDFIPADQIECGGAYIQERTTKDGIGAPTVAASRWKRENSHEDFVMQRVYYGVTALARIEGRRCVLSFADPLSTENVPACGHTFPLAADFTVPLAVMLARENPRKMEIARLFRPGEYAETAHITRLQPYDPDKAVVLVIHGLMDSPATWTPLLNTLRGDPEIRRRYQFWFYSYPSGYPYPHSAAILRRELDAVKRKFPLKKPMTVIGHSMGGCISRLLITDSGDSLWMSIFEEPPSEVPLSKSSKALISEALIFKRRPEVGRVIFIAAPLRGSDLASHWLGRLCSRLIRSPVTLLSAGDDAIKFLTFQGTAIKVKHIPNSVDTLAPDNRFVVALQKVPLSPGIPYHSIVGDRGKGGNSDRTPPVRSDGVVPYWSSHLEGARSELIIPSGHGAHRDPRAIAEVRRILKLNPAK